jgi:hypothetical protein
VRTEANWTGGSGSVLGFDVSGVELLVWLQMLHRLRLARSITGVR